MLDGKTGQPRTIIDIEKLSFFRFLSALCSSPAMVDFFDDIRDFFRPLDQPKALSLPIVFCVLPCKRVSGLSFSLVMLLMPCLLPSVTAVRLSSSCDRLSCHQG
jgi:hypothetical protein